MGFENVFLGLGVLLCVFMVVIFGIGYVKAPPDKAFIISGLRKTRRIIGSATMCIPFLERLDKLDLATIPVDVKTATAVPTKDYINIQVDSIVNIKVPTINTLDNEGKIEFEAETLLLKAQQNFLNRPPEYISKVAKEVLEGNIREIIGQMTLQDMVQNRQKFADQVKKNAAPDLAELGLIIVSFNVQNFNDDTGTIENLGIDNIERIRKDASIAKAHAKRDVEVEESRAEKESNDARVEAQLEIAKRNADLEIRKAELKKDTDTKKAVADAAHRIQEEEQRKTIEVKTVEANIAKQEKEVQLTQQKIEIEQRRLEAEVNKVADAKKYEDIQKADAERITIEKLSEAQLAKAKNEAEAAKVTAEARRYAAEQDAQAIKAKGLAEADAIRAQGLAKAAGLDAEAEAMKKMEEAAVIKTVMEALPLIAKEIASPLANIDKITMYGEGNSAKLVGDITKSLSQITNGLTDSMGIDVKGMINSMVQGKVIGETIVSCEPEEE